MDTTASGQGAASATARSPAAALGATPGASAPRLDLPLFSDASLRDPFADYRTLRDAGPVVRLSHPDVYAIGRFADVQTALRNSDALISGEGVGFSDLFNASKGRNVIQSDGDVHRRMRATVMRPLTPATLRESRADLKTRVAARIEALAGQGWFDAMTQLAAFLPVEAVSHLVGLPAAGRERMLSWASAAFNVIGPEQGAEDVTAMREAVAYMAGLTPETVRPGSWAGELFAAARNGRLSLPEAVGAISAYVIPSLDTTILAKGHLLYALAQDPEQWSLVATRPELIPSAVLETLRRDAPIRWFSRVAAADYVVDGATAPAGARVMLLYGSANRDERRYPDPDRFDVTRDARDHLAWGTGAHMCAGMHLARMEMEVLLEALVESGVTLEAGEPEMGVNRGLYGFTRLSFRMERA